MDSVAQNDSQDTVAEVVQTTLVAQASAQESITPTKTKELVIPSNAVKLSSGVYVTFKKIPSSKSTDIMLKAFTKANLDKNGNLITDNLAPKDQIALIKNISEYHTSLITWGVELVGEPEDYYAVLDIESDWLRRLIRTNLIDADLYDLDKQSEVNFIFLRYQAFGNEEDWTLLSEKLTK